MPLEAVPLFRPDALRPHLAAFCVPEEAQEWRQAQQRLADLFRTPYGLKYNEKELLPDFLTDVFLQVLGYMVPVVQMTANRYTVSREKLVEVDKKFADTERGAGHQPTSAHTCRLKDRPAVRCYRLWSAGHIVDP